MKVSKIAAVVAVSAVAASAFAAGGVSTTGSTMVKQSGVYVGVNAGYGKTKVSHIHNSKNNNFYGGGYVGYQVNRYYGVEVGVNKMPSSTFSANGFNFTAKYWQFYTAVKGMLPLKNHFGLYAKLGWARSKQSGALVSTSISGVENQLFYAGGVSYTLPRNVTVNLGMEGSHSGDANIYAGVAGVGYLF